MLLYIISNCTKMANSCGSKRYIFQDSIDHCRWKSVLHNVVLSKKELQEHNLHQFSSRSFDEILFCVYNMCHEVKGIGMLTIYDITSAICKYNKINIEKVFIIGNGPKRAIRLLDVKAKTHKIQNITLKYVEIPELLKAFHENKHEIDLYIKNSNNGDEVESYICNWQKDIE